METANLQQSSDTWYVYAIECSNGSVYIGQAKDILSRWKKHQSGNGARWTKKYKPVCLFYYEQLDTLKEALKREKELKTTTGRRFLKKILIGSQSGDPTSELLIRIQTDWMKNHGNQTRVVRKSMSKKRRRNNEAKRCFMEIKYSEKAVKQIKQIHKGDKKSARMIMEAIEAFAQNPSGNFDIKVLKGKYGEFKRLRVGKYRIIFDGEGNIMFIYEVKHRQEAYNG